MNSQTSFDYIIVGQGLAGSCLALQLLQRSKSVLVIDRPHENSATQVAAGLFNPLTGRSMTKTWLADTLFSYLHEFYKSAEQLTGSNFFNPMPLYRPFLSVEEQNEWMGKSADESLASYIGTVHTSPMEISQVQNKFGGLLLKQCGYLNTIAFTQAIRNYIKTNGVLLDEDFNEEKLIVEDTFVRYNNYQSKRIIFCHGEKALEGKLFSWLPIRPLKGETLTIKTDEQVSKIYNRGVYVVPNIWKVGATYQAQDLSKKITAEGLKELTEKLNELIIFPYEITNQSWGIRPTTPDRKPILGTHPNHQNVLIFNGLGTKGVSLAPYFSKVLVEFLENSVPLNKEVDIQRYKHYNYGGNLPR